MPRDTSGLKRGGPGRPKGVPNKATSEIKQFCQEFLRSKEYVASAQRRVRSGKAPHLETLWHHYGFGKPAETVNLKDKTPRPVILDRLTSRDQLTAAQQELDDEEDE